MHWTPALALPLALLAPAPAHVVPANAIQAPSVEASPVEDSAAPAPVISVAGQSFQTWQDYVASPLFRELGLRCGTRLDHVAIESTSDCSSSSTTIRPEYQPTGNTRYRIPVVVHILRSSGGTGDISDAMVQSQIDVLNEDFQAIAGTLGENGNNARIEFFLATTDPSGNPTTGITRSSNTTWFNDGGAYYDTLNWDPQQYLNLYTNLASGALGYVPTLPSNGIVGANNDRVVILWSAFGRNAPIGPPFDLGRTATHEIGHYLGLYHTFDFGCGSAACYTTGDRVCDTNAESGPVFGCPGSSDSCASLPGQDPFHNYMDYSDDACYQEFTPEQVNRMRCTLENWRVELHDPLPCTTLASTVVRAPPPNVNVYTGTTAVLGGAVTLTINDPLGTVAVIVGHGAPRNLTLSNGYKLLVNQSSPFYFRFPLALPPNQIVLGIPNEPILCGLTAYSQATIRRAGGVIVYTNAVDMTAGL